MMGMTSLEVMHIPTMPLLFIPFLLMWYFPLILIMGFFMLKVEQPPLLLLQYHTAQNQQLQDFTFGLMTEMAALKVIYMPPPQP